MILSSNNEVLCLIDEQGKLFRETRLREEIQVNSDHIMSQLDSERITKVPLVGYVKPGEPVSLCVRNQDGCPSLIGTIPVSKLVLRTNYAISDGVLAPKFEREPAKDDPILPLVWDVEIGSGGALSLYLLVVTQQRHGMYIIGNCYLIASDQDSGYWRLPLPNVHSDCRVCTGEYTSKHATFMECMDAAYGQFLGSNWNSDLLESTETTQKFFRFKAEGNEFTTMQVEAKATKYCQRVNIPQLEWLATGGMM